MKLHLDDMVAGFLDRAIEHDSVLGDFDPTEFLDQAVVDVLGGDGSEGFALGTGFKGEK